MKANVGTLLAIPEANSAEKLSANFAANFEVDDVASRVAEFGRFPSPAPVVVAFPSVFPLAKVRHSDISRLKF